MAGHLRKRGPNTWALVYDLPRGLDGKRRQKWATFVGTKREADQELTRLLRERDTGGQPANAGKQSVAAYLARWLEAVRGSLQPTSYGSYEAAVRLHLAPALGHLPLARLSALHVEEYYASRRPELSESTLKLHHAILTAALRRAVRWGLLPGNPCEGVEPPRAGRRRFPVLDAPETLRLLTAAADTRLHLPILLGVTLGLRRGEVLGLRWVDVDLWADPTPGGILRVEQQLVAGTGKPYFSPPKDGSAGALPLPAITALALLAHQVAQAETRTGFGGQWHEAGLVVTKPDGRPWPFGLNQMYRTLLEQHGFPLVRFHDLRHSHVTQLLDQGVNLKVIQERVRHRQLSTTANVYSHLLPGRQAEASALVDRLLRRPETGG